MVEHKVPRLLGLLTTVYRYMGPPLSFFDKHTPRTTAESEIRALIVPLNMWRCDSFGENELLY